MILVFYFRENGLGPGGVFMGVWKMGGLVWFMGYAFMSLVFLFCCPLRTWGKVKDG